MPTAVEVASPPGAAELARRTIRLMAGRQLAPTPGNYRLAWREVGGTDEAERPASPGRAAAGASRPADDGQEGGSERIGRLVEALDATVPGWTPRRKREGLRRGLARSPDPSTGAGRRAEGGRGARSGRIGRLVAALDATVPAWTPGRKRAGVRRVLASSPDASTLAGRIDKLVVGWTRPWGELTELVPAATEAAV